MEAPVGALGTLDERQVVPNVVEEAALARDREEPDGDDKRPGIVIQAIPELGVGPRPMGMLIDAGAIGQAVEMVELDYADNTSSPSSTAAGSVTVGTMSAGGSHTARNICRYERATLGQIIAWP